MPRVNRNEKGFTLVIVLSLVLMLTLLGVAFLDLIFNELQLIERQNRDLRARYLAEAGILEKYQYLRGLDDTDLLNVWENPNPGEEKTITFTAVSYAGGTYAVTAQTTRNEIDPVVLTSTGVVNGVQKTVQVSFSKQSGSVYDYVLAANFGITLLGAGSRVDVTGNVASNFDGSPISVVGDASITGTQTTEAHLGMPQFSEFEETIYGSETTECNLNPVSEYGAGGDSDINMWRDINGDGYAPYDMDGDGILTAADGAVEDESGNVITDAGIAGPAFIADNVYSSDGEVNGLDAFHYYYTHTVNSLGYDIGEGEAHYYSGSQTWDNNFPSGVDIVYVDGNVTLWTNAQEISATIVSTGNIFIGCPDNPANGRITLVSHQNIEVLGWPFGGQINMNLFAEGNLTINTAGDIVGAGYAKNNITLDARNICFSRTMAYPGSGQSYASPLTPGVGWPKAQSAEGTGLRPGSTVLEYEIQ